MNLFIHFNVPPQFIPKIEEEKPGQYYNVNFLLVFFFLRKTSLKLDKSFLQNFVF